MTYKDNTPTYNVNRRVVNFKDFDPKSEGEELEIVKKSYKKNELEKGQKERKTKYNRVTHKLDDLDKSEVEDKLDSLKESLQLEDCRKEAESILENCKRYFMEDSPGSTDTVISLSDAIEAVANHIYSKNDFD